MENKQCEHEFVFKYATQSRKRVSDYSAWFDYKRTEFYFCKKCLEERVVEKYKEVYGNENIPNWWVNER